jgi:hypothetical protein
MPLASETSEIVDIRLLNEKIASVYTSLEHHAHRGVDVLMSIITSNRPYDVKQAAIDVIGSLMKLAKGQPTAKKIKAVETAVQTLAGKSDRP